MTGERGSGRADPGGGPGGYRQCGQRFVELLHNHPWFRLAEGMRLGAFGRTCLRRGRPLDAGLPPSGGGGGDGWWDRRLLPLESRLVFSGLDAGVAGPVEEAFRPGRATWWWSNRRNQPDGPPGPPPRGPRVNPEHLALLEGQALGKGDHHQPSTAPPSGWLLGAEAAPRPNSGCLSVRVVRPGRRSPGAGNPGGLLDGDPGYNVIPFIRWGGGEAGDRAAEDPGTLGAEGVEPPDLRDLGPVQTGSRWLRAYGRASGWGWSVPPTRETILGGVAGLSRRRWHRLPVSLPPSSPHGGGCWNGDASPQPRLHGELGKGMAASVGPPPAL